MCKLHEGQALVAQDGQQRLVGLREECAQVVAAPALSWSPLVVTQSREKEKLTGGRGDHELVAEGSNGSTSSEDEMMKDLEELVRANSWLRLRDPIRVFKDVLTCGSLS